jgi:predicted ATPase/class 3 adenylate cyclase
MAELPSGTVTFLFTDIEGSTRLLDELGSEAYAEALAEHRRVLREAFARHGGVEVDTQGDAFFYAFTRPSDALAAAAESQAALANGPARVRMGLHTGEPTLTGEGYVGADVHLGSRVMSAGHGRQVLVSSATAALVTPRDNVSLGDLGEHRLKDIERPVRLFQLGDGRFPPLRTLNNSNLPLPATPLLGRKKELADALRLVRVDGARLVTVTGPGGIGKTRFALEIAHELVEEFSHGVWFVDLSALRDVALVVPTIASTLGAKGELADHVADKRLLLVLDNFEQVVEAANELAELLRGCPNARLLVTSRQSLRIAEEHAYSLRPLPESPAVELFRARATATDPAFDGDWGTLTAIVERLDRLPLAIELAAARTPAIEAGELLDRLEQRLPLLTGQARDRPERQQTLRATIEWSYGLLEAAEQRLFARLSVFSGGWTLEAAEQVCDADLDALEVLVDRSLVRLEDGRYSMLETVREYAEAALSALGEGERTHVRRRNWTVQLAEATYDDRLAAGLSVADAARRLANEQGNIRASLEELWQAGDAEAAARLAGSLSIFWVLGHVREGAVWLERLLDGREHLPAEVRARLLVTAADLAKRRGDWTGVRSSLTEATAIYRDGGSDRLVARGLAGLAEEAIVSGRDDEAEALLIESLRLWRAIGDEEGLAGVTTASAHLALYRRRLPEARRGFEVALELFRVRGNDGGVGMTLSNLGVVAVLDGRMSDAKQCFLRSLQTRQKIPLISVGESLDGLAAVALTEGRDEHAIRLSAAAERWRDDVGQATDELEGEIRAKTLAALRERVPAVVFEAAWSEGSTLTEDEAIAVALGAGRG